MLLGGVGSLPKRTTRVGADAATAAAIVSTAKTNALPKNTVAKNWSSRAPRRAG